MLFRALMIGLAAAWLSSPVSAQCDPRWFSGGWNLGFDGSVYASTLWDPDGPGPEPQVLVVAGQFTIAGDVRAPGIAAWDGSTWRGLGDGLTGDVYAMTARNGELIIGGRFLTSGQVRNLARLVGPTWQAVDPGFTDGVFAFATHHGDLMVSTFFEPPAGASRIRRWDGTSWQQLGTNLQGYAWALASINGDLIAGGSLEPVPSSAIGAVRWNGSAWESMPAGAGPTRASPYVFAEFRGDLYAGCSAWDIRDGVWRWDGAAWTPVGDGLSTGPIAGQISVLGVYGDRLIAGGGTKLAGSIGLSQWDGSHWQPWPAYGNSIAGRLVYTLITYGQDLIAGGTFTYAGPHAANSLARWDGQSWHAMSAAPTAAAGAIVRALTPYGGSLAVGGSFVLDTEAGATGNVASWDGNTWRAIGPGLRSVVTSDGVNALAEHMGDLYAGGQFAAFQTGVVKWDGYSWSRAGSRTGTARAMGHFGDDLIVAGTYMANLGQNVWAHIARWDGQDWQGLPTGPDDRIDALTTFNGELVVGGGFLNAGGQPVNHIAAWNGSAWRPLGGGLSFSVTALAAYSGRLIAAGQTYPSLAAVAAWDGTAWQYLPGVPNTALLYSLAASGDDLYVGGNFAFIGGIAANSIARWDGSQWNSLGSGLHLAPYGVNAYALMIQGQSVVIGGSFADAGGVSAPAVARWGPSTPTCYPNCDCSQTPPLLNVADFACFISKFTSSDPYANCDGSTTPPTLNVLDFMCFLDRFAAGCR